MRAVQDSVVDEMTRRIVGRFNPEKVVLFGSRARGDARPHSDYDLLVVLKACRSRRRSAVAIRSELADLLAGKDILVATAAEIEGERPNCSVVIRAALEEGRVLYERLGSGFRVAGETRP